MRLLNNQAIRRANLLLLLEECGEARGAAAKLSRLTGVPQPFISQLKRQVPHSTRGTARTMGNDTARALEKGMGKPPGWMDHDHSATSDQALRIAHLIATLTPEQQQIIMQTAQAFAESNGRPPPEDGPDLVVPTPKRH